MDRQTRLSPEHTKQLDQFIDSTFDARLRIALRNQEFCSTALEEQRRRAHIWLLHYGKIAMHSLRPRPGRYQDVFPDILKYFAENSLYYSRFFDENSKEAI